MASIVEILQFLLPLAYGALLALLGRVFFGNGEPSSARWLVPFGYGVVALHAIYIGLYTIEVHHCLLATIFEMCSLLSFTLFATYAFVELRPHQEGSGTGFFVTLVSFLLQFVSSITVLHERVPELNGLLKDPIFNAHVTSGVFGYAALMLAAIYGGLYLLLYRAIRRNEFGPIFQHLPSLERLERYGVRASAVGFVFLTLMIYLGALLIERNPSTSAGWASGNLLLDPKILMTLLIWAVFGITLLVRKLIHLEGRKLVLFWMSGFALTILSMTFVNAFGTAFHSFF